MALTLVSTVTVGSGGAATLEWTNIPQTGTDLLVLVSARSSRTSIDYFEVRFNATDSSQRFLFGDGSAASSSTNSSRTFNMIPGIDYTASTFGNTSIYVSNYISLAAKSLSIDGVAENNATATGMGISAGSNANTSALTTLTLRCNNTFVQHSTASLYIVS